MRFVRVKPLHFPHLKALQGPLEILKSILSPCLRTYCIPKIYVPEKFSKKFAGCKISLLGSLKIL